MSRGEYLPSFTDAPGFDVSRASLDKIELRFFDFVLEGENARSAVNDLIRDAAFRDGDQEQPMFRAWNPARRLLVDVASGYRSRTAFVPVFTGKLVGASPIPDRVQFSLSAKLSLTRAILAQKLMRRHDKPAIGRGPYTLLIERQPPTWKDEYPLLDATNVLIGPDLRYAYAMARPATDHLVELVRQIELAISVPLSEAVERHGVRAAVQGVYSLQGAEVFWEFETPSPLSTVDLLSGKLAGVVNSSRATAKAVVLPVSKVIQQSRSIQLDLGNKMGLRVYAKTNRRVRFEVFFGRAAITAANARRRLSDHAALATLTDVLIRLASQRLTELFREMSPPVSSTAQASTADLLKAIEASHHDRAITVLVLDGLRHFGRVVPDGSAELLAAVRKLKRQGVLRIVRRQQSWYGLSSRYLSALANLTFPRE